MLLPLVFTGYTKHYNRNARFYMAKWTIPEDNKIADSACLHPFCLHLLILRNWLLSIGSNPSRPPGTLTVLSTCLAYAFSHKQPTELAGHSPKLERARLYFRIPRLCKCHCRGLEGNAEVPLLPTLGGSAGQRA